MTIKGIVFDFDGLILDTEMPDYKAWQELFQSYGIDFPLELYTKAVGRTYDDATPLEYLESMLNAPLNKPAIFKEFKKRKIALTDQEPLRAGVLDYLRKADEKGLAIGLASSSKREWILPYLEKHGIVDYFDSISTLDDVTHPKPDPQLYLRTIQQMKVTAEEAIAFEDSLFGVAAAKNTGLFTVAVPNDVTRAINFSMADMRLESLSDIQLEELIEGL